MGLTGFVIIHVFSASFSPAQGERNQTLKAKFTRPVNVMSMSNPEAAKSCQTNINKTCVVHFSIESFSCSIKPQVTLRNLLANLG